MATVSLETAKKAADTAKRISMAGRNYDLVFWSAPETIPAPPDRQDNDADSDVPEVVKEWIEEHRASNLSKQIDNILPEQVDEQRDSSRDIIQLGGDDDKDIIIRNDHVKNVLTSLQGLYLVISTQGGGELDIRQDMENLVTEMLLATRTCDEQYRVLRLPPPDEYGPVNRKNYLAWRKESRLRFDENGNIHNDLLEMLRAVVTLASEAQIDAKALKQMLTKAEANSERRREFP